MTVATVAKQQLFVAAGQAEPTDESISAANAVSIELLNYGYDLDPDISRRISEHQPEAAREIADKIMAMFTLGDLNPPLFRNWEERTAFTFGEFVVQILGYTFQISGNDLADPQYMDEPRKNVDYGKVKKIVLANDDKSASKFQDLVNTKVPLDKKSVADLRTLAKTSASPLLLRDLVTYITSAVEQYVERESNARFSVFYDLFPPGWQERFPTLYEKFYMHYLDTCDGDFEAANKKTQSPLGNLVKLALREHKWWLFDSNAAEKPFRTEYWKVEGGFPEYESGNSAGIQGEP